MVLRSLQCNGLTINYWLFGVYDFSASVGEVHELHLQLLCLQIYFLAMTLGRAGLLE